MRENIPAGHVVVQDFEMGDNWPAFTRKGKDYYVEGRKVTLKQALMWWAKMERTTEASAGDWQESARFLSACAKLMK